MSQPRSARQGFALLLTITLLAFLVVLIVGLGAYLRVETAVAGNTQRQAQARQNALLALDVALGQLQKYAGPDQRVTATADALGGGSGTRHFTGVWDTTQPAGTGPLTWLVSGNEYQVGGTAASLSITPATRFTTTNSIELVGSHTSGTARDVVAPLQPVTTVGAPGVAGATAATIGRYAWWVGDQGVKAPVTLADPTAVAASFNYAPYTSAELLTRIRQQVSLGAGPADTSGSPVFEPRDTNNTPLDTNYKITAYNQIAFLKNSSNTALGLTPLKTYFHIWSPNNFAVLANTKLGGLRQDLSLFSPANPSPLGPAYDAWANYDPANGGYMEDPTNPTSPAPLTAYGPDPVRRRYAMQSADSAYGISPVLSFFGLSVSVHNNDKSASPTNLEVSVRCVAELWNPYSSALIPDLNGLQLRITGLPTVQIVDDQGTPHQPIDLQAVMGGGSMNFSLPWTPDGANDDRSSWLPGRVYCWSALSDSSDPGDPGNPTQFYVRDSTPSGSGIVRDGGPPMARDTLTSGQQVFRQVSVGAPTTLIIELHRVSDGKLLATFTSPQFNSFATDFTTRSTGDTSSDFAFIFRMPDAQEIPLGESATWLQAPGRDPREVAFPSNGYVVARGQGPEPELLVTAGTAGFPTTFPSLLLDRYTDAASENYTEDVPLFELPRSPLLSVGMLQHLRITGARPFAIGNSWTNGVQLNSINVSELFDRFFFSGLATNITPAVVNGSLNLPNPLLKVLARNSATGAPVALTDLQTAPNEASSKFLLQGGAFNLNSVNPLAWSAVLRGVRFSSGVDFHYLDANPATGTADDASTAAAGFTGAAFLRFPQSAQEVYKADDNYAQSQFGGGGPVINTPLYHRVHTLSATDVTTLANAIVALIQQRQAASGPFISIEDFLTPPSSGGPSLLEQAIANANLNANVAEFSSQWLTQADIMTALAPVLFPRSDTFIIRTYGEAVNQTTAATEGRAWCEAIVQRVPDYFDPVNATTGTGDAAEVAPTALVSTLNQTFGRRFKIISFRWLTRSDI